MSTNEHRLLALFAALVLSFASIVGVKQLRAWSSRLEQQEHTQSLRKIEADALLEQATVWKQREAWVAEHQPRYESESVTTQELFDFVDKQAKQAGLTITSIQYKTPLLSGWHAQFGVDVTVKGKLPQVFRFVYDLQNPADFRVIPYLKVTPDKDDAESVLPQLASDEMVGGRT